VYNLINEKLVSDVSYNSGRILGAMSTQPHPFAAELYSKYLEKNLGDRGLNPGTAKIESQLIQMMANLLGNTSNQPIEGNMTSGGTESNLIAMYLAKSIHSEIKQPNIVLSEAAHYSFKKIARLMNIELRYAPLDDNYRPKMDIYATLIDENTISLVGIAGTSSLGLVDPIDNISSLAKKHRKFLHIDGAFGGFVLPFLEKLGHIYPTYDFRSPYISSFSVDPHKMGMNVNPSGIILVRNQKTEIENGFQIPYLAGGGFKSFNILGTRPGAPAIAFWGLIHLLGMDGFLKIMQQSWDLTKYLEDQIQKIPHLQIAQSPQINVLGIQFTNKYDNPRNIFKLNQILREHGWYLGYFEQWSLLRFVSMPHVTQSHIDAFLADLRGILNRRF
ncbi:MAG: tyrosine decarboxylase MfnA, partial [Promethearchaeota archaeon]